MSSPLPAPARDAARFEPGRWRMLNLTWVSFFLTFVVWYNLGAFSTTIARVLGLTKEQSQVLLLCNLALTIPARVGVGMLVDRLGPRRVYTWLLAFAPACVCEKLTAVEEVAS